MMQKSVERLKALGQMPDARRDDPTEETLERYDQLLSEVETPLSYEEAEALVGVFPEGGTYGLEWTLLRLVESYADLPGYRRMIAGCPSEEWRGILTARLDNYEKKHGIGGK